MSKTITGTLTALLFVLSATVAIAAGKKDPGPPKPGENGTILFSDKQVPKKFKNKKARMAAFEKSQKEFMLQGEEWTIHFHALLFGKAKATTLQLYFIDVTDDPMNEKPQTILQVSAKRSARALIDKFVLDTEDFEGGQKLKLRVMRVNMKKGLATVLAEGEFQLKGE